ncbi:hypothetical protein HZC35_05675 [Candidatus Saganbacteria bacterium]|nr:hypothetical protein [Candidatus Saganbacteria bacterium]
MALKVSIEGLRFRANDRKTGTSDQMRIIGQRLSNSGALRLREGDSPADLQRILSQRQPLNIGISEIATDSNAGVGEIAVVRKPQIELPEIIDDPRLTFKVARGVIVESLSNGRAIAVTINEQNPGRKFRVPTEPELLKLNGLLGDRLEGTDYWIWTETETQKGSGYNVLRHLDDDGRHDFNPEVRHADYAVRLVEDR